MMIWRWLRKYAGKVCLTLASSPAAWVCWGGGQRRITLALRPSCGAGWRVSRTTNWAIRSSPAAMPSACGCSVATKLRRVAGPLPVSGRRSVRKVMFSPLPWARVRRNSAPAATA